MLAEGGREGGREGGGVEECDARSHVSFLRHRMKRRLPGLAFAGPAAMLKGAAIADFSTAHRSSFFLGGEEWGGGQGGINLTPLVAIFILCYFQDGIKRPAKAAPEQQSGNHGFTNSSLEEKKKKKKEEEANGIKQHGLIFQGRCRSSYLLASRSLFFFSFYATSSAFPVHIHSND